MSLLSRTLLAAAAIISAPATASGPSDTARIRALEQEQAAAWNAHDAKRYMDLFTPDTHVVNVLGWHWRGRPECERKLSRAFSFVFAKSHLSIGSVEVRFLKPDIAIAYVLWAMSGAMSPAGGATPPQQGLQTQTLVKKDGRWLIAALQNTNSIPERDFPLDAPGT